MISDAFLIFKRQLHENDKWRNISPSESFVFLIKRKSIPGWSKKQWRGHSSFLISQGILTYFTACSLKIYSRDEINRIALSIYHSMSAMRRTKGKRSIPLSRGRYTWAILSTRKLLHAIMRISQRANRHSTIYESDTLRGRSTELHDTRRGSCAWFASCRITHSLAQW